MTLPIGLQLFSVRDLIEKDLPGTCQKVREIGYTHVEVGQFAGHTTPSMTMAARDAGLEVISTHENALSTATTAESTLRDCQSLELKYAIVPWLAEERRTAEEYTLLASFLAGLHKPGLTVGYHNHEFEFEPLPGGECGWDILFKRTELSCEMDTCWVAVGGRDPVAEMEALRGRLPLLHVKDCSDYENKTLCEIGTGKVPVKDILQAAPGCGVELLIVEQDHNWIDNDPMKSAAISFENLKTML